MIKDVIEKSDSIPNTSNKKNKSSKNQDRNLTLKHKTNGWHHGGYIHLLYAIFTKAAMETPTTANK